MLKIKTKKSGLRKRFSRRGAMFAIIFVAILSPVFLGLFQTKAVGTKPPGIWYDRRSGHYKMDVAALQYSGIIDDLTNDLPIKIDESVFNRAFNFHGNSILSPYNAGFNPPGVYNGCSMIIPADLAIYGPGGSGIAVCDEAGSGWSSEPVLLWNESLAGSPDLGFNGVQDIDAITAVFAGTAPIPCGPSICISDFVDQTVYIPHGGVDDLISFLNATPGVVILGVFESIFVAQGAGKDYTVNSANFKSLARAGYPPLSAPYISPTSIDYSIASSVSVDFWNTDGLGGIRDDEGPDAIVLDGRTGTGDGRVNLFWPAVADNPSGTLPADSYILRYSLSPSLGVGDITNDSEFNLATDYDDIKTLIPKNPGDPDPEKFTVNDLTPNAYYYFSIKACDQYMNCSDISNSKRIKAYKSPPPVYTYNPHLIINSGAIETVSSLVNLAVADNDPKVTKISLSNLANLSDLIEPEPLSWLAENQWDICSGIAPCSGGEKTVHARLYNDSGAVLYDREAKIAYSPPPKTYYNTKLYIIDESVVETTNNAADLKFINLDPSAKRVKIYNLKPEEFVANWKTNIYKSTAEMFPIGSNGLITNWDLCKGLAGCASGKKWVIAQAYDANDKPLPLSNVIIDGIDLKIAGTPSLTVTGVEGKTDKTSSSRVNLTINTAGLNITHFKVYNGGASSDVAYQEVLSPTPPTISISGWDLCKDGGCDASALKIVNVIIRDSEGRLTTLTGSILFEKNVPEEIEQKVPADGFPPPIGPIEEPPPKPAQEPVPATLMQKIEKIVEDYGTPAITAILAVAAYVSFLSVASSFADLMAILRYLLILLLQALGIRRKNKNWGVVYNSTTKTPLSLCIVRLFNAKTGILEQTSVTDKKGRFGLFPTKGWYYMSVTKPFFSFPSHSLKGIANDVGYNQLYFGEKKFLTGHSVVNFAVPLDRTSTRKKKGRVLLALRSFLINISTPIAVFGALLTLSVMAIQFTVLNTVIFALHLSVLVLKKLLLLSPHKPSFGIIDLGTGKPMANIVLKIFSKKYNKLVTTKVSDKKGKFDLFLPDGQYYLRTGSKTLDFARNKKGEGYVGEIIDVNKEELLGGLQIYLKKT